MSNQERVFQRLNELKIEYRLTNHQAVFTIEDINKLSVSKEGNIPKNLFLRDSKGKRHFLVVMDQHKKVNLKELQDQLACSRLGFASENRLAKYLGLTKGAVTPLGVINDKEAIVEVVFDMDLIGEKKLGVHPNDNTATVWLSYSDLKKVIENNGNAIGYVII